MDTPHLNEWLPGVGQTFTEIFNDYYKRLCFYAYQFVRDQATAEDLVQDCFVKVWNKRDTLSVKAELSSLLYTMVRNAVYDHLHSHYRLMHVHALERVTEEGRLDEIIASETLQAITTLAEQLPEKNQEIFRLLFVEGLDHTTAAECLNIPESTLRSRKARVLSLLREYAARILLFSIYFFYHLDKM